VFGVDRVAKRANDKFPCGLEKVLRASVSLAPEVLRRLVGRRNPLLFPSFSELRYWFDDLEMRFLSGFGAEPDSLGYFSFCQAVQMAAKHGDLPLHQLLSDEHVRRIDRCDGWFFGTEDTLVYDLATIFPIDLDGATYMDSYDIFNSAEIPSAYSFRRLTPIGRAAFYHLGKIVWGNGKSDGFLSRTLTAEYGLPGVDTDDFYALNLIAGNDFTVTAPEGFWGDHKEAYSQTVRKGSVDLLGAVPKLPEPFYDLFPWQELRHAWSGMSGILLSNEGWSLSRVNDLHSHLSDLIQPVLDEINADFNRWNSALHDNRPIVLALVLGAEYPEAMDKCAARLSHLLKTRSLEKLEDAISSDMLMALTYVGKFYDPRKAICPAPRSRGGQLSERKRVIGPMILPLHEALEQHKVPQHSSWAVRLLNGLAHEIIYSEEFFEDGPLALSSTESISPHRAQRMGMALHGEYLLRQDLHTQRALRKRKLG